MRPAGREFDVLVLGQVLFAEFPEPHVLSVPSTTRTSQVLIRGARPPAGQGPARWPGKGVSGLLVGPLLSVTAAAFDFHSAPPDRGLGLPAARELLPPERGFPGIHHQPQSVTREPRGITVLRFSDTETRMTGWRSCEIFPPRPER